MRLSNVLENGNGSPGSLAVLYLELAARLSLPLEPVALEGGRYYVLQPADDSVVLSAAGKRGCCPGGRGGAVGRCCTGCRHC